MCIYKNFPERITFHHDGLLREDSFNSSTNVKDMTPQEIKLRKMFSSGAHGHLPHSSRLMANGSWEPLVNYTYTLDTTTKKYTASPKPVLSSDFWDASMRIAQAEFGDKTFLLLVTLTIAWAKWHNDDEVHDHADNEDDVGNQKRIYVNEGDHGKSHGHIVGYHVNPLRILAASTAGVVIVNVKSIVWQSGVYANEVRLFVSFVLVVVLANYMYTICSQQLENLTALEKMKREDEKAEDSAARDGLLAAWKGKEERKKTLRKIQRAMTIKHRLLDDHADGSTEKLSLTDLNVNENIWKRMVLGDRNDDGETPDGIIDENK